MKHAALVAVATTLGAGIAALWACGASGSGANPTDAGPPAADAAVIARGEYLVKAVALCGECHTPRLPTGQLDTTKWLAGVDNRFDIEPDDDTHGAVHAPNLTPHESGLGGWKDDEIKRAIVDGVGIEGPLTSLMPSYVFHNMASEDADAIVAYLRSLPPVDHLMGNRQKLSVPVTGPSTPLPEAAIPHTTLPSSDPSFARAEHGRYLTGMAGLCIDCHSTWRPQAEPPLALGTLFAGGRGMSRMEWSVDGDRTPPVIYSYNLTPHPSGLKGWTPPMIVATLKTNLDDQKQPLCRPMPGGPMGSYAALTDDDALDIALYITTLPPIDSGEIPQCPIPKPDAPPPDDAGVDAPVDAPLDAPADGPKDGGGDASADADAAG